MNENSRRCILIVDDDAEFRTALETLLFENGYEVVTAEHGGTALRLVERTSPDAILLDLNMPVMGGEDFARQFRSKYGQRVPIVIYTATPKPRIAEQIGNARVLNKPVELEELLSVLNKTTAEMAS
ncbi:MAG: response regulator [Thermomicrobiales bacterium]